MLPLTVGYVPFALAIGSAAADSGEPLAGWAGSLLIFGGSAHLGALQTLGRAGPLAAVLTGLAINTRLALYSVSLGRSWADQPRWFRWGAAALIVDPTWAVAERHAATCTDAESRRGFFLGAALTLAVLWCTAIAVGAALGARLDWARLPVVVPLVLAGNVAPALRAPRTLRVALAAAAIALLTTGWPPGTGMVAAIGAGCLAGFERGGSTG